MIDERFPNWDIDVENGTVYNYKLNRYIGRKIGNYIMIGNYLLHRVIWMVANGCNIPEGYEIHHIDHNTMNNSIYNLEMIDGIKHRQIHTKTFTNEYKIKMSKICKDKLSFLRKKVGQYSLEGNLIKIWDSIKECENYGFHRVHISECCKCKRKTHKGFIWKYYEEEKDVA